MLSTDSNRDHYIILASGSPRRRQLFSDLHLECVVVTADVDETPWQDEKPDDLAVRLASLKASAVHTQISMQNNDRAAGALIIAADTVVAYNHRIMGKPVDKAEAYRMLSLLRDDWHQVHSAVTIVDIDAEHQESVLNTTQVRVRNFTDDEIVDYISSGDPFDKAGAYAIQHPTFAPVLTIEGCLTGVMGLPLGDLRSLLGRFGVKIEKAIPPICEEQASFICCQRNAIQR